MLRVRQKHATVLSQLSGPGVGPDLHVFPWETQKFLALLGIATSQSLLESTKVEDLATSYVGWRCKTVSLDDASVCSGVEKYTV
jgi:hypothetical protein